MRYIRTYEGLMDKKPKFEEGDYVYLFDNPRERRNENTYGPAKIVEVLKSNWQGRNPQNGEIIRGFTFKYKLEGREELCSEPYLRHALEIDAKNYNL